MQVPNEQTPLVSIGRNGCCRSVASISNSTLYVEYLSLSLSLPPLSFSSLSLSSLLFPLSLQVASHHNDLKLMFTIPGQTFFFDFLFILPLPVDYIESAVKQLATFMRCSNGDFLIFIPGQEIEVSGVTILDEKYTYKYLSRAIAN